MLQSNIPNPPPAESPGTAQASVPEPPRKRFGCGTCFSIGIALVAALFILPVVFGIGRDLFDAATSKVTLAFRAEASLDPSQETMKHFYNSLIGHDFAEAYKDIDSGAFPQLTEATLASDWHSLEEQIGNVEILSWNTMVKTGDENHASIYVRLGSQAKKLKYTIDLDLNKYGDHWKITNARPALVPQP